MTDDPHRSVLDRLRRQIDQSHGPDADLRSIRTRRLNCLLSQVRDRTPEEIRLNVERAVNIYAHNHGVILDMLSSIQLVVFGLTEASEDQRRNWKAASKELIASLRADIRVVAFEGDIAYGNIGTDTRMNYTVLLPEFDRLLAALLATEFGQVNKLGTVERLP